MPLHHIYSVPRTFSTEDKKALAKNITKLYTSVGLPAFYVVVLFLPVEQENFFVGGKPNEGKMVRILVDHLARTMACNVQVQRFFIGYESVLAPFIKDRGLDWEIQVVEADANLWRENGLIPPVPDSAAEKEWVRQNKAVPYTDEQNEMQNNEDTYNRTTISSASFSSEFSSATTVMASASAQKFTVSDSLYMVENWTVLALQCVAVAAFSVLLLCAHCRRQAMARPNGLSASMQLFVVSNLLGLVTSLPTSLQKVFKMFDPVSQLQWIFWLYAINGVYQRSVAAFFLFCLTLERILMLRFTLWFIHHRRSYLCLGRRFTEQLLHRIAIFFYTLELPLDDALALACAPTICITPKYKLYKQNALKIGFSIANFFASILFLAWLRKKDAGRKIKNRTVKFTIFCEFIFDIIPSSCDCLVTLITNKTASQLVGPLPLVLINFGLTLCSLYYAWIFLMNRPATGFTTTATTHQGNSPTTNVSTVVADMRQFINRSHDETVVDQQQTQRQNNNWIGK